MRASIAFILLLLLSLSQQVFAERTKNVSASILYYPPENLTVEEAKRNALERARIQAIADEFGTTVSQYTFTNINVDSSSEVRFQSIGNSEVNGEWVKDTKEPKIAISYENNIVVISVTVWGIIREKRHSDIELFIKTFCNGIESEKFKNNDRFNIEFRSPIDGFLSVWLVDDKKQQSYCLLPYETDKGVAKDIESNKNYTLLSTKDPSYPYQEETILTTNSDKEINRLVIIFSPKKFIMPITENGDFVPELSIQKFELWLQRNHSKDDNMVIIQKFLEISI